MRIASLLPGATETCFALGLGDQIVGVSHECDTPVTAKELPALTSSSVDATATSRTIDRQVRDLVCDGLSLYDVDLDALREAAPDLIVTQDMCNVCAVTSADVEAATRAALGKDVVIVSLAPLSLDDVLGDIERVAAAAEVPTRGAELVGRLRQRLDAVREATVGFSAPRVLMLEWLDPPMPIGHWTPRIVRIAGGQPVLARDQVPTGPLEWSSIAECEAEVLLLAPCGFGVEQTQREVADLLARPELAALPAVQRGRVYVADGNHFFNRPGPRLVESAEIAAVAFHPDLNATFGLPSGALARIPSDRRRSLRALRR